MASAASVIGVISGSWLAAGAVAALSLTPLVRPRKPQDMLQGARFDYLYPYKRRDDWRLLGPLTAFVRQHAGPHVRWNMEAHQQASQPPLPHVVLGGLRKRAHIQFSLPAWRAYADQKNIELSDQRMLHSAHFALAHELVHTRPIHIRTAQANFCLAWLASRALALSLCMTAGAIVAVAAAPLLGLTTAAAAGLVGSAILGTVSSMCGLLTACMVSRQQEAIADRGAIKLCGAIMPIYSIFNRQRSAASVMSGNVFSIHYSDYNRRRELRYYFQALGRPVKPPLQLGQLPTERAESQPARQPQAGPR